MNLPVTLFRKTDLKNWAGVYVWNPHHRAHPPAYFCVRARLTTASGHVVAILRGHAHTIDHKRLKTNALRLSLCAKVKPFGFTPMYAHVGTQASAWAVVRPPPSTPISERNCHSHTDSLLRPPVVPKCVRSRLLCAHNACVVVPECKRVAYAVGHGRVHVRPR